MIPKLWNYSNVIGRGAYLTRRRLTVRTAGALSSENAGVSSDKTGENPVRQKPKVSRGKVRPPWVSRALRSG
jgi:hypothetical protein